MKQKKPLIIVEVGKNYGQKEKKVVIYKKLKKFI